MNRESLAWAAGLFEGEGCFNFYPSNGSRMMQATLVSTDKDVVEAFQSVVGMGTIYERGPQKEGWKRQWRWNVSTFEKVQALIAFLWPWLKSRRRAKCVDMLARYHAAEPAATKNRRVLREPIMRALKELENIPLHGRRWMKSGSQSEIAKNFNVSPAFVSALKQEMRG